jgi:hypothetical protein
MDFDVLVRSNSLPIFLIPVQIRISIGKNWTSNTIPHVRELEATAFRNFGITKFFFPSKTLFNRSKPFSFSQSRTKLIPLHFNSSIVIDAILDSTHVQPRTQHQSHQIAWVVPGWHTCLKQKCKFPTPLTNSRPSTTKKVKFPPS